MEEIQDFLTFFMKITPNIAHPKPNPNYKPSLYLSLNLK